MLTVFIGLDTTSTEDFDGPAPDKAFMGFGYNPDLSRRGERLDMLDFFSWMRRLESIGTKCVIYDASGYSIVNRTSPRIIDMLGPQPRAEDILSILVDEQDNPKRADIKENCSLRALYLERLISISGLETDYIDSRQVFREDPGYAESLDYALGYIRFQKENDWDLLSLVLPKGANSSNSLYLPLEMAEALYLKGLGVDMKYGPSSERLFDMAIIGMMESAGLSYATARSPLGPRKPGYLSDRDVIWTTTATQDVEPILEDEVYRGYVSSYMQGLMSPDAALEEGILEVQVSLGQGDAR